MSTLQEIKNQYGKAKLLIEDASENPYKINRYDMSASPAQVYLIDEFDNESVHPITEDGWTPVIAPASISVMNEFKQDFAKECLDLFIEENLANIFSGTWQLTVLDEMTADADLNLIGAKALRGELEEMKSIWDAKATNGTWFTQARKDHYSGKLEQGIAQALTL